jgi:suppressor of ftsI
VSTGIMRATSLFSLQPTRLLLAMVYVVIRVAPLNSQALPPVGIQLPAAPEVNSPVLLKAVTDPATGKSAFSFRGVETPPVIRSMPGTRIRIDYVNEMSSHSHETCVDGTCKNMTNLHFHGLHISPNAPQDDVITMMAMPGESLHYMVDVPLNQPPGLYWYHTHPHGESYQQSLDGMSGAIVIEGIERYAPEVAKMPEKILVLRDFDLSADPSSASRMEAAVSLSSIPCGKASGGPQRIFTVNGAVRPKIPIAPGERQFWRIVNASPDLYADLEIDSSTMRVIALDGMPLAFHEPNRRSEDFDHVLLAPAGRVEAIVQAPLQGKVTLRSRCVDTGAAGDPNPEMILADLDERTTAAFSPRPARELPVVPAKSYPIPNKLIREIEHTDPGFVVNFTEDQHGFYINGKKYGPDSPPMTTVQTGKYMHWRVVNETDEIHPFHIHQVHFLTYAINGLQVSAPLWMDTINVPARGKIDLVMDFTDPIIKGMSVFHCHLLKHEDKGMMAKILFR